ncbi:MAG: hypothetical protein V4727_10770, partial [Verrucomicrobiota bacterium]
MNLNPKSWLRQALTNPEFTQHLAPFATGGGQIVFDHADEASHSFFVALACIASKDLGKKRQWIVHESPRQRERLATELELWGISAMVLPEVMAITGRQSSDESSDLPHEIADPETAAEWFSILETLATSDAFAVICGPDSFSQYAPSAKSLLSNRTHLKPGLILDPTAFAATLTEHGYERFPTVTARGHFAIRGGILDLFPFQSARPLRLEF